MKKKRKFRAEDLAIWQRVQTTVLPLDDRKPLSMEALLGETHDDAGGLVQKPMPFTERKAPINLGTKSAPKTMVTLNKHQPLSEIDGLARSTRRAIKRGNLEPTAKLDLHGLRLEEAETRLANFLRQSARAHHRVVLIVTGKGGHKRVGPMGHEYTGVIRRSFPEWLRAPEIAPLVSHFTPAHVSHGGDGAWYVFIRASARRS